MNCASGLGLFAFADTNIFDNHSTADGLRLGRRRNCCLCYRFRLLRGLSVNGDAILLLLFLGHRFENLLILLFLAVIVIILIILLIIVVVLIIILLAILLIHITIHIIIAIIVLASRLQQLLQLLVWLLGQRNLLLFLVAQLQIAVALFSAESIEIIVVWHQVSGQMDDSAGAAERNLIALGEHEIERHLEHVALLAERAQDVVLVLGGQHHLDVGVGRGQAGVQCGLRQVEGLGDRLRVALVGAENQTYEDKVRINEKDRRLFGGNTLFPRVCDITSKKSINTHCARVK